MYVTSRAQELKEYKPVTPQRLLKPEDGDWLMVRRTYDGWGYSPLEQITPANVARLQPAWVVSTGVGDGHEAPPIVNNGVMFVATPGNQVIALDAKSGARLWRYKRPRIAGALVPHDTSRGVARTATRYFAGGEAVASRSTRRRARKCGRRRSPTTRRRTTSRWRRSSPTAS